LSYDWSRVYDAISVSAAVASLSAVVQDSVKQAIPMASLKSQNFHIGFLVL
jgi:hypothetical protein